jgi:aryl carrier-like protein
VGGVTGTYAAARDAGSISLRGAAYDAGELEEAAARAGTGPACAVQLSLDHEVVLLAELSRGPGPGEAAALARSVRAAVAAARGIALDTVAFVPEGALPRNGLREVDRPAAASLYRRAELELLASDALGTAADGTRIARAEPAPEAGLTLEAMREAVAQLLGEEPGSLADDADLVAHGLDSMRIMALANEWRRAGVELRFADLFRRPTLAAWWALASSR